MSEFLQKHITIVREKGHEWQIKVVVKAIVLVAGLSLAAHATYQKSFDRKGLAQLVGKEAAKDGISRREVSR
jgi:hypothetical protein